MGFSIGSIVEKVCDKVGLDEDWGDAIGLAADAGALYGSLALSGGTATIAGRLGGALVGSCLNGVLEHADDLVEDWGADPMTSAQWKDEIRRSGYAHFEQAVRDGRVDDDVLKDPAMQAMRQEQEESQAQVRNTENLIDSINARLASARSA